MGNERLAQALRASPRAAPLIQRSQYLTDALKALQDSGDKIQSGTELWSKLAATALNQYSLDRTNKRLKTVDDNERENAGGKALAALMGATYVPKPLPEEDPGILARLLGRKPAPVQPLQQPMPTPPSPAMAAPQQPPAMMGAPTPPMSPMGQPPAPNLDQEGPIPDVSYGQTPAGPNYPLGIRNNNPGNLRDTATPWQGATGAAGGFETFDTPENGIRAMARNLNTYGKRGINTLEGIISTYAPPSENPTANYVATVSRALGIDPRQPLDLNNPQVLEALSSEMIKFENGRNPYSPDQMSNGVQMALGGALQPPAPQQPQPAPAMPQAGPMAPAGALPPVGAAPAGRGPTPEQIAYVKSLLADPATYDQGMAYIQKLQQDQLRPVEYDTKIQDGNLISIDPRNPSGYSVTPIAQLQARKGFASDLGLDIPGNPYISIDAQGKPTIVREGNIRTLGNEDPRLGGFPAGAVVQEKPGGELSTAYAPGGEERKIAGYAHRAISAMNTFNDLARRGIYKPTGKILFSESNGVTRMVASDPNDRAMVQAMNEFLLPVLRKETGAAVTASEFEKYKTYVPQPEDTQEVLFAKARARADLTRSMINEAGPVFKAQYGEPQIKSLAPPPGGITAAPRREALKVGTIYQTVRGPMVWTGKDFVKPGGR